jgi:acyl-CoA thioester hydrolase
MVFLFICEKHTDMSHSPYRTDLQLRFRDTDALGHINNAVYHSWIELCRTRWLDEVLGCEVFSKGAPIPIILARTEMDFLREARLEDRLYVEAKIVHVGQKSFHQSYEIKRSHEIIARAKAVLVWFDFERRQSVNIPADKRALLLAHCDPEIR